MEPSLLFLHTGQSPTASTRGRKSLGLPFFSNILPFSGMQVLLPRLLPVCPLLVFATEIHQQSQALASPNKSSIMTSSISPEGYAAVLKVCSFFPHYLVQTNWSLSPPPAEKTFLVLRSDDLSNQGQSGEERLLPPFYDPLFQYHRPEKIQFSLPWTTYFLYFHIYIAIIEQRTDLGPKPAALLGTDSSMTNPAQPPHCSSTHSRSWN